MSRFAGKVAVVTGAAATGYACDITDQLAVDAAFDRITTDFGGLHILINNAGITRDNLFVRMSKAGIQSLTATLAIELGQPEEVAAVCRRLHRLSSLSLQRAGPVPGGRSCRSGASADRSRQQGG